MGRPKSKVPEQILEVLGGKAMPLSELVESLGLHHEYVAEKLRDLRQAGVVRVSGWVRRGKNLAPVWAAGDPATEPDAPRPERGAKVIPPWRTHLGLPDEDSPEDFPRTLRDPARGITRHYSGVRHDH